MLVSPRCGVAACSWQNGDFRDPRRPATSGEDGEPGTHVQHFLEHQNPVVATRAAVTVLVVACEVLASFIGENLTRLLLHETWPDEFDGDYNGDHDMTDKVPIRRLLTGVPGLDAVLGGGLPEFSFNVVAGAPGAGKTTLVQQIMFALARPDRPALYFTVLGEPPLKMLRYQQQFEFFNIAEVNASVRFVNLAKEALEGGLDEVLRRIAQEVEAASPAIVIVDSFRSVIQAAKRQNGGVDLQRFVQDLGMRLTGWQATTFLVGEFQLTETEDHPVFTVADGLVWLYQSLDRNSMVRKMQVMKMRGQAPIPGLHTFRITNRGIQVFPATHSSTCPNAAGGRRRPRRSVNRHGCPLG